VGMLSKRKGYRNENQLVHIFRNNGVKAERCPLSGGALGRWRGFDLLADMFGQEFKIETKHIGKGFKTIYGWLAPPSVDMLIIRSDHNEPLVVLPLSKFIELHHGKDAS
jgi:hypothetical protein